MNRKIMIVDDERDVARVIGQRLELRGYKVLYAFGGKSALKMLERETPDLILLDIVMPDMGGIEVCNRIHRHKYMSSIPIVFFTVRDSLEDKIEGLKKGVYDYISKPVDHRELLARVEAVINISQRYRDLSFKDELTGLYNYNFFKRQFSHCFNMAKRYGRGFSLIITDIDDFKKINDLYGHLYGNFVIKKVSEVLNGNLRKVDFICRYGGDEFAIILSETGPVQAGLVLDKIKKDCGKMRLSLKKNSVKVRLSFGLASYSEEMETERELFDMADKNMYQDKRNNKL